MSAGIKQFEEVFMFSHRQATTSHTFITLFTDSGANITASHGHYIWALGQSDKVHARPITARNIRVGDCLLQVGGAKQGPSFACVIGKVELVRVGLYNPHTASGSIVVDDIAALTFTDTLPPIPAVHSLVTLPARLLYLAFKLAGAKSLLNMVNNGLLSIYFPVSPAIYSLVPLSKMLA